MRVFTTAALLVVFGIASTQAQETQKKPPVGPASLGEQIQGAKIDLKALAAEIDAAAGAVPAPLDLKQWNDIGQHAETMKGTVVEAKKARRLMLSKFDKLGDASNGFRTTMARLEKNFIQRRSASLTQHAEYKRNNAPGYLLQALDEEAAGHGEAADAIRLAGDDFAKKLAGIELDVVGLRLAEDLLNRLEAASDDYVELARLGRDIASLRDLLSRDGKRINSVLAAMRDINQKIKQAVSETISESPEGPKTPSPGQKKAASSFPPLPGSDNSSKPAVEQPKDKVQVPAPKSGKASSAEKVNVASYSDELSPEARYELGVRAIDNRQLAEAETLFRRILEDPNASGRMRTRARQALAHVLLQRS
jgi:hypothetical protein